MTRGQTVTLLDADWLEWMGVDARPVAVAAKYYLMGYGAARYHTNVSYERGSK